MSDTQFLEKQILNWINSKERLLQIKGFRYYDNQHDILFRKRTAIGDDGSLQEIFNLPNNKIIDNIYAKLVNQKADYLLGKPITFDSDNILYTKKLKSVLGNNFMKTLKSAGKSMLNGGIAWLFPFYDDRGNFSFRLFPAYEILPFWNDSQHTSLDLAVRLFHVTSYDGFQPVTINHVEVFAKNGIHRFILKNNSLSPDYSSGQQFVPYVTAYSHDGLSFPLNWSRIPLIPLKYGENESPLLKKVKSIQDAINIMLSDFLNNMQEDARNTILVLKNYDGQDLAEFRRNLAAYSAVKVRSDDGGGVDSLEINVDSENYKSILHILKSAIIQNAMGFDAKDDRLSNNPNQMNIQSMYSDIDLDANDMETELQSAFEHIIWFVDNHLANTNQGFFFDQHVNVIFNRDVLINESEAIDNCRKSVGILSDETIVSQHPWIADTHIELQRLHNQQLSDAQNNLNIL